MKLGYINGILLKTSIESSVIDCFRKQFLRHDPGLSEVLLSMSIAHLINFYIDEDLFDLTKSFVVPEDDIKFSILEVKY